jgi:hypothetical protein
LSIRDFVIPAFCIKKGIKRQAGKAMDVQSMKKGDVWLRMGNCGI